MRKNLDSIREFSDTQDLYAEDGKHPNEAGSRLAAETITNVLRMASANVKHFFTYGLIKPDANKMAPLTDKI